MLANDVINFELRRLVRPASTLSNQVEDLTARIQLLEADKAFAASVAAEQPRQTIAAA